MTPVIGVQSGWGVEWGWLLWLCCQLGLWLTHPRHTQVPTEIQVHKGRSGGADQDQLCRGSLTGGSTWPWAHHPQGLQAMA